MQADWHVWYASTWQSLFQAVQHVDFCWQTWATHVSHGGAKYCGSSGDQ